MGRLLVGNAVGGKVRTVGGLCEIALNDELLDPGVQLLRGDLGAGAALGEDVVAVLYGDMGVVERGDHPAEDVEEPRAGRVLVDQRAVAVAYGVPVDALGGEERVVLLEGPPGYVEGATGILG